MHAERARSSVTYHHNGDIMFARTWLLAAPLCKPMILYAKLTGRSFAIQAYHWFHVLAPIVYSSIHEATTWSIVDVRRSGYLQQLINGVTSH